MENSVNENIDQAIVQNLDIGNIVTASLALKEAAELLKDDEKDISNILLLIVKSLLEKAMVQEVELNKIKSVVDDLKSNQDGQ